MKKLKELMVTKPPSIPTIQILGGSGLEDKWGARITFNPPSHTHTKQPMAELKVIRPPNYLQIWTVGGLKVSGKGWSSELPSIRPVPKIGGFQGIEGKSITFSSVHSFNSVSLALAAPQGFLNPLPSPFKQ